MHHVLVVLLHDCKSFDTHIEDYIKYTIMS